MPSSTFGGSKSHRGGIVGLRSYALNPKLLLPKLAGEVAIRFARFREISRTIEVLQTFSPDQISINALDEIAYELRERPRQASAAALAVTGRLAGGDPSIWKTVRALKMRPGTLRVRVAGDYRLLFEIGQGDSLRLVDFILRRDLDRWLAAGGR